MKSITFDRELALSVLGRISQLPVAVLICRLASDQRCDYLITGRGDVDRVEQSWSQHAAERLSVVDWPSSDDMRDVLEIRLYAQTAQPLELADRKLRQLDGQLFLRTWEPPITTGYVLQAYAWGVDKWPALAWLAERHDIALQDIAMVGDHVNDVAAIRAAGCGVAMGNAVEQAKAVADRITKDCDDAGLAHAIDQLLSGRW